MFNNTRQDSALLHERQQSINPYIRGVSHNVRSYKSTILTYLLTYFYLLKQCTLPVLYVSE